MTPGNHRAGFVDARLDPLGRDRVEEIVVNVVLARPLHAHRRFQLTRKQRSLDRVIAFRFAAETATEQGDVHGHRVRLQAERLRDVVMRAAGALHRRPNLGRCVSDVRGCSRRLHADMGEMRQVIFADDHLVGALQRRVDVALVAHD
jgi:hypothetical protein